jgi:hypothetical protein
MLKRQLKRAHTPFVPFYWLCNAGEKCNALKLAGPTTIKCAFLLRWIVTRRQAYDLINLALRLQVFTQNEVRADPVWLPACTMCPLI